MVWCPGMLGALAGEQNRRLALSQLPRIIDHFEPIGPLAEHVAIENGMEMSHRPLIFPTSDDQQAGLVGGGAVDSGQMAVILGNSAAVNSSSQALPHFGRDAGGSTLDVMRLNWGPYLWMRCYNNGAVSGSHRRSQGRLESAGTPRPELSPGAGKAAVLPFVHPEPSLGVSGKCNRPGPAKNRTTAGSDFAARGGAGILDRPRSQRARASGSAHRADYGFRRDRSQRPDVRNSGVGAQPAAGTARVGRRTRRLGAAVTALAAIETHLRPAATTSIRPIPSPTRLPARSVSAARGSKSAWVSVSSG